MRALAVLFLCGAALAQERAFVEVTAAKEQYYVGELLALTLRFGYDREFFRTNAVRLFARDMDVPVHVEVKLPGGPAPWARGMLHRGPRFALNDGVVKATSAEDETRDGRVFTIVEVLWDHTPSEPGDVGIAPPTLRYAYATEFESDFVMGRVGKDPKQEIVSGKALNLRILALPEEGRPPEFDGAVGRFTVSAEANPTTVDAGKALGLTFRIEGFGNAMKRRFDLPGFHVYGTVYMGGGHTAVSNIAPLSAEITEIPAIRFAFFDPGPPAGYRVVSTDPIPLEVRPGAAPEPPSPPPAQPRDGVPDWTFLVVAALGVASAALALWARARRRAVPPDPETIRVQTALAALHSRVGGPDPELAFAEFLAAYLRCPPAAVIGPDLPARLAARGMEAHLAVRAAATLERLVAARYGGGQGGAAELAALLPEIEAATGRGGSPT